MALKITTQPAFNQQEALDFVLSKPEGAEGVLKLLRAEKKICGLLVDFFVHKEADAATSFIMLSLKTLMGLGPDVKSFALALPFTAEGWAIYNSLSAIHPSFHRALNERRLDTITLKEVEILLEYFQNSSSDQSVIFYCKMTRQKIEQLNIRSKITSIFQKQTELLVSINTTLGEEVARYGSEICKACPHLIQLIPLFTTPGPFRVFEAEQILKNSRTPSYFIQREFLILSLRQKMSSKEANDDEISQKDHQLPHLPLLENLSLSESNLNIELTTPKYHCRVSRWSKVGDNLHKIRSFASGYLNKSDKELSAILKAHHFPCFERLINDDFLKRYASRDPHQKPGSNGYRLSGILDNVPVILSIAFNQKGQIYHKYAEPMSDTGYFGRDLLELFNAVKIEYQDTFETDQDTEEQTVLYSNERYSKDDLCNYKIQDSSTGSTLTIYPLTRGNRLIAYP